MVRIREKHLATRHTVHGCCVSESPKCICPLLPTDQRGVEDKLGVRRGEAEKGCSEGNTHNTTTFSLGFSSSESWTLQQLLRRILVRGWNRSSYTIYSVSSVKNNLRAYKVLALPLFHSLSPAPPLLNCPLDSGFLSFFLEK